ncbi:MAG: response regulator [Syntrophobacteraceae bacterium]
MALRILLADDHRIVREGLRSLILQDEGMTVVAEAENGRTTVSLARKLTPDIIIMDIGMPDLNGIEATRQIVSESPETRVIALSMHSDKRFIAQMLKAGASAYLLKDCAFEELAIAIQNVSEGKIYLSPAVARPVLEDYIGFLSRDDHTEKNTLTPREREVMQLLAEGQSTRNIAEMLHVSVKTVDTHRYQIMNKLQVKNIAELVKFAVREGITAIE